MNRFLLLAILFLSAFHSYGQDPCVPNTANLNIYGKGNGFWMAYVYQLDPHYSGDNVTREFPLSRYKGMLPYRPNFLPHDDQLQPLPLNNFDINFDDPGGYSTDENYFTTIQRFNQPETADCPVQLQNFAVVFRTRINIERSGIYKITVGSDDGSFLKDGNDTIHNNWGTGKTYVYEENLFNYYRVYEPGDQLNYDLSYYEKSGSNRISFNFELYFGPGEIDGSQDVCGIAPDPAPFRSRGPAAFEHDGSGVISYQWQYHDDDTGIWNDIPGADQLTYKVPRYDKDHPDRWWTGIRRYRRMATVEGVPPIATEEVEVNINPIPDPGQEVFGDNQWIGYVYKGVGDFDDPVFHYDSYLGRFNENSEFRQNFGGGGLLNYQFPLDEGCPFLVTTNFSIRYKMKLDVLPGVYTFKVSGDDGFRLRINGTLYFADEWKVGPESSIPREVVYNVTQKGKLEIILEYFENTDGNVIDFSYPLVILPLEWGQVSAEACGPANCLTWETIQEKNTSHFELERSYNGMDWEMFDNSVLAQGNSTEKFNYEFTDKQFMASKVYYRIRQVDLDDAYEYSEVMRVDNPFYATGFLPFPNPTMDKIRFFSKSEVVGLWLVSNDYLVNKEVKPEKLHDNRYEVDLVGLKPGNYVIIVQTGEGEKDIFKVIKK